jgi:hypothetical protein
MVPRVTSPRRGVSCLLVLVLGAGCGVMQRPSVKMVDPGLVAHGIAMERERVRGGFALGPYVVRDLAVRSEAPDPDGPLAREDVRRPVTQDRAELTLEAPDTGRTWTSVCTVQRRAPRSADFHAVLDENGDEVAVDCTASTKGVPPWRFRTRAALSRNFVGQVWSEAQGSGEDEPPTGEPGREWTVEILTRAIHFERLERLLPVPVAQLRHRGAAELAVVLGRPERAWVARKLDPQVTEPVLALLLTLRLLPWELAE